MVGLSVHGAVAILLTMGALFLFTRERLPLEYSCLAILTVLVLGLELFPYSVEDSSLTSADVLAGFGNEALITIMLLLVLAKGVEVSGALRPLARLLARAWLLNRSLALLATLLTAAALSAFVNNTPVVAMLLPLLVGVANRIGVPASRMLMPVGFATIVGGMSTTIGTSSNLLIVSVSADMGLTRLEMFDFFLPASIAAGVAIVYLWLLAPRFLPVRESPLQEVTPRLFETTIEIRDDSPLIGKTLADLRQLAETSFRILRIRRGSELVLARLPSLTLRAGDSIHIRGTAEAIKEVQSLFGGGFEEGDLLRSPDQALVEVVVTRESPLYKRSLRTARAMFLGSLIPVGIYRPSARTTEPLDESADPQLASGDVLLMQGTKQEIHRLQDQHRLFILARNVHVPRAAKAPLALAIVCAVVGVAALGWVPIIASALCGVGLMLFSRCMALEEVWDAFDGKLVLVIVTSLALGAALTQSGAAEFIAFRFVDLTRDLPAPVVLSGLLLLTALLTELVTNNAVAVISTPIAIAIAQELGLPEIPFVLAVLFGANMSYLTPIGYQTNLLVYSIGGYRFSDFFRVGIPLQVLLWITLSVLLPTIYL